jgi:uncharacterized protein YkwD
MKKLIHIILFSFAISATAQDSENKIFLELVNAHRASHGLSPVEYSATLDSAVTLHVNWMIRADTLEHYEYPLTPDGIYYTGPLTRIEKFDQDWKKHFSRYSFRENVGAHYKISSNYNSLKSVNVDKSTVIIIFNEWVKSASHNAALLDPKVTVAAFDINGGYDTQKNRFSAYANCLFAVKL